MPDEQINNNPNLIFQILLNFKNIIVILQSWKKSEGEIIHGEFFEGAFA